MLLASMTAPSVSVVVLNYRSPRDTVRCVRAILGQTIASELAVFVVDNHSDDESIGFIRAHFRNMPSVRIIENRENIGYGQGNNAALPFLRSEYVLIINPDNTLPPDGVEQMRRELRAHPDIGIVGPMLVHPDGSVRPSARPFPKVLDLLKKRLFPEQWHKAFEEHSALSKSTQPLEVDWLVGACIMMRTDEFLKLGGFDPRFFLFFEDIDLCRRLQEEGKKVVFLPSVRVEDRKGRLSGSSIFSLFTRKTTRIHLMSGIKYFLKWAQRSA